MIKLKIGLFGFGCVGQGLYDVLSKSQGLKADIVKICVKQKEKKRPIPSHFFTFNRFELLDDPQINVIVELIDDADEAFKIVKYALEKGKNVVTSNKKMVAYHLRELVELQKKYGASLLYEASSCGSIPIIRTLEEYYDNELLFSIAGIFNGTSNYILTKTIFDNLSYDQALKEAQDKGFAETDPTNDVEGFDAKYKSVIVAAHAFGLFVNPEEVFNFGISTLAPEDINYAREKGLKIKLVPTIIKHPDNSVSLFVAPKMVNADNYLFNVEYEFNGVIVEGAFSDKQFFSGKGAGGHPTGSAVLSDISALSYDYKYEYKKFAQNHAVRFNNAIYVKIYLRYEEESLLEELQFKEIFVKHTSSKFRYVIGLVPLKSLIRCQEEIKRKKLFFALTKSSPVLPIS